MKALKHHPKMYPSSTHLLNVYPSIQFLYPSFIYVISIHSFVMNTSSTLNICPSTYALILSNSYSSIHLLFLFVLSIVLHPFFYSELQVVKFHPEHLLFLHPDVYPFIHLSIHSIRSLGQSNFNHLFIHPPYASAVLSSMQNMPKLIHPFIHTSIHPYILSRIHPSIYTSSATYIQHKSILNIYPFIHSSIPLY